MFGIKVAPSIKKSYLKVKIPKFTQAK